MSRVVTEGVHAVEGYELDPRSAALLAGMRDCAAGLDRDWRVVWVNAEALRFGRIGPEALLGRVLWELFPMLVGTPAEAVLRRAMDEGRVGGAEFLSPVSGRWMEVRLLHAGDELVIVFDDLTGRREEAEALRRTLAERDEALAAAAKHAAFLTALGDTVPGLLWAADAKGRLEYGNRALEAYFGRSAAGMEVADWEAATHPDHRVAVGAAWARAHATGGPLEVECPLRRHDGAFNWFLIRATPHVDAGGRRWIGVALDVTERRRADEQLRDAQRLQSVGQLAGGVAHEVNNQMTVVLGMAALVMRRLELDHPAHRHVEYITAAGTRAANITRQLLAFSRRQILKPELLDLNDLLLAFQPVLERIVGAHTPVVLDLAPGRPTVRADRGQLEQVLVNLVSNSRDAMVGGGRLTLATAVVDDAHVRRVGADGDVRVGRWIALEVQDTGAGMTPEVRTRAFEPFFTTRAQGEGTGLGLATVYGILTQSGGHVALESAPGKGTTVHVFLPEADGVPEGPGPVVFLAAGRPRGVPGQRGRVVVAEDEPGVRAMIAEVLEEAGYEVFVAAAGDEAARLVEGLRAPPALLVTDVVLPGLDGSELAERVRARWPVPVLYISGYAWEEVVRRGLLSAERPFLQKPFGPEALVEQVRSLLGGG